MMIVAGAEWAETAVEIITMIRNAHPAIGEAVRAMNYPTVIPIAVGTTETDTITGIGVMTERVRVSFLQ